MNAGPDAPVRLLSARWVLPISRPPLAEGAVLVDQRGTVLALGPRASLRAEHPGAAESFTDGALLPGLVNAHTHLELSALAELGKQRAGAPGLVAWAGRTIGATAALTADEKARAAGVAARDARASGVVAVGEVCNALAHLPEVAASSLQGAVFHELLGSRETRTGDALADAAREHREHVAAHGWPAMFTYVPAPHAPYSVGPDLLRRTFAAAAAAGRPTSIHVAEDPDELALLADGTGAWAAVLERLGVPRGERTPGLSPLLYLAQLGAFAGPAPPVLVHMVHATPAEMQLAAQVRAPVVLCPRSNLHIGGRLPNVPALRAAGVRLAIGSDSLASSPSLGLWEDIATLSRAFPDVAPAVWLHAATAGGAAALGFDRLGTLELGKRPGVLAVGGIGGRDPEAALTGEPPQTSAWLTET